MQSPYVCWHQRHLSTERCSTYLNHWPLPLNVRKSINSFARYFLLIHILALHTNIHVILLTIPLNPLLNIYLKHYKHPCSNEHFPSGARNERGKAFPARHPQLLPRSQKTQATSKYNAKHFGQTDQCTQKPHPVLNHPLYHI